MPPKQKKTSSDFIQRAIPPDRRGVFRAKAKDHGMSTAAFIREVLANPSKYDEKTKKEAELARTLSKLRPK